MIQFGAVIPCVVRQDFYHPEYPDRWIGEVQDAASCKANVVTAHDRPSGENPKDYSYVRLETKSRNEVTKEDIEVFENLKSVFKDNPDIKFLRPIAAEPYDKYDWKAPKEFYDGKNNFCLNYTDPA